MPTVLSLTLSPLPSAGSIARAALRERFAARLRRATFADLELVVSELVTNAVEHGSGTIEVEIEHSARELRGCVSDRGDGFAYTPRVVAVSDRRGRGLAIVDTLVTRWGIRRGSTEVWFAITLGDD